MSPYSSIHRSRKETRLIEIIAVEPQIIFKLHIVSLLDEPVFSALSYVWGDPTVTVDITVNGSTLSVTRNLALAVLDIHRYWTSQTSGPPVDQRRLWADGVCINQKDIQDKNYHVPLMKEIYSGADQVLSWLGAGDHRSDAAFAALQTIHHELDTSAREDIAGDTDWMEKYPHLCHGYTDDPRGPWLGIIDLMHCPYWSRVWIFQEVYLARRLILICGSGRLEFSHLESVQQWHEAAILGTQDRPPHISPNTWAYLQTQQSMFESISAIEEAREITLAAQRKQRRVKHLLGDTIGEDSLAFYNLVETHALLLWTVGGVLEASDPRDSIYALLGISGLKLEPDYSPRCSAVQVYLDFLRLWEHCSTQLYPLYPNNAKSGILDLWFLIFAGMDPGNEANPLPELPSWAPNFPAVATRYGSGWSYSTSGMNHFPVGETLFDGDNRHWKIDGMTLECPAIEIDRVAVCGPTIDRLDDELISWIMKSVDCFPTYPAGYHSTVALHRALIDDNTHEDDENYPEPNARDTVVLLGTLVWWCICRPEATHSPNRNQEIALLVQKVWQSFGLYADDEFELFQTALDRWPDSTCPTISPLMGQFLDVQRLNEMRAKFELSLSTLGWDRLCQTEKGYLGRFPTYVKEGDVVCLLKGYDGPVILRRIEGHYIFIGSSFIVEPLAGRSEADLEALKTDSHVIEIR